MKRIIFLSLIFSAGYVTAMDNKSIVVENNSDHIISIVYKDPACCILEKLQPHNRLSLLTPTHFIVIAYQNEQYRFSIGNSRHHCFSVESKKNYGKDVLAIFQYDDQYIIKSKKDCLEGGPGIFE